MACRLHNRSSELLRIDLRGGTTLQLAPGATSEPLREELLYENVFVPQWERSGLLVRLPARFDDVLASENQAAEKTTKKAKTAKPAGTAKPAKAKSAASATPEAAPKKKPT